MIYSLNVAHSCKLILTIIQCKSFFQKNATDVFRFLVTSTIQTLPAFYKRFCFTYGGVVFCITSQNFQLFSTAVVLQQLSFIARSLRSLALAIYFVNLCTPRIYMGGYLFFLFTYTKLTILRRFFNQRIRVGVY